MSNDKDIPSIGDAEIEKMDEILSGYESIRVETDFEFKEDLWQQGSVHQAMQEYANLKLNEQGCKGGWVSVKDKLPEEGQIVDIWEMPMTQHLERALSLRGTDYAKQYYHDTDYNGWRSTNYKFSIEHEDGEPINCFTKCNTRYLSILTGRAYKKICVENGEVTHWMPILNFNDESLSCEQRIKEKDEKLLLDFCHFLGSRGYKINGYDDNQLLTVIKNFFSL